MSASDKIARLRELRAKATAGPWVTVGWNEATTIEGADVFVRGRLGFLDGGKHKQDADAIVAAMNSLPKLLDAAEALQHLLRHSGIADVDARDKDKQDHDIERKARAALDALAEGGGE